MPLVLNEKTIKNSTVGVWNITEPLDFFLDKVHLGETEKEYYLKFQTDLRRKHWLSYRLLLKYLLQSDFELYYDTYGKPFIRDYKGYISVSHSGDYAAAIIDPVKPVGIDIEKITPRIEKVFDRFMNPEETAGIDDKSRLEYLYVYWCTKEALYKMHGAGNLAFDKDLFIKPFDYSESGIINSQVTTENNIFSYDVLYKKTGDYMLAYTPV